MCGSDVQPVCWRTASDASIRFHYLFKVSKATRAPGMGDGGHVRNPPVGPNAGQRSCAGAGQTRNEYWLDSEADPVQLIFVLCMVVRVVAFARKHPYSPALEYRRLEFSRAKIQEHRPKGVFLHLNVGASSAACTLCFLGVRTAFGLGYATSHWIRRFLVLFARTGPWSAPPPDRNCTGSRIDRMVRIGPSGCVSRAFETALALGRQPSRCQMRRMRRSRG